MELINTLNLGVDPSGNELSNSLDVGTDPGGKGCIFIKNRRVPNGCAVIVPEELPFVLHPLDGYRNIFIDLKTTLNPLGTFDAKVTLEIFQDLEAEVPAKDIHSAIERVWGLPRNQGMFGFGLGVGFLQMAHQAVGIDFVNPTPQFWKEQMGFPKESKADKAYSIGRALGLCPELEPFLKRKCDDGRAEAYLLSQFARKVSLGEIVMPPPQKPKAKKSAAKLSTKKAV